MKKNRNFWPVGILAVIVIGIVLLVYLVMLSVKDPVIEDNSYFEKYDEVEKNINTIMQDTKEFEAYYSIYMDANQKPENNEMYKVVSPYFAKGHRDKLKEAPKIELFTDTPNKIYVSLVPNQKSSALSDIEMSLFVIRYHMQKQDLKLGSLKCDSNGMCLSPEFDLDVDGRWKAVLEVKYVQDNQTKKIFFQKDFFASKHP